MFDELEPNSYEKLNAQLCHFASVNHFSKNDELS
jgi:hypothetical protein